MKRTEAGAFHIENMFSAGWTPLHEACSYGWHNIAVILIQAGANVNARGMGDDTPLHDAANNGHLKVVKYLVECGADPYLKNKKGKMPFDVANHSVCEYLASLKGMLLHWEFYLFYYLLVCFLRLEFHCRLLSEACGFPILPW